MKIAPIVTYTIDGIMSKVKAKGITIIIYKNMCLSSITVVEKEKNMTSI
jgi:hypothetical protein